MAASTDIAATVSASVIGMQYFDLSTAEFDLGSFTDHATSGQTSVALGTLAPGDNVRTARVRVAGVAFHGTLQGFHGTRVTKSPIAYDAGGNAVPGVSGQHAFVIDFGGVRTVLGLTVPAEQAHIVLVLPWAGTDFAPKPIYPVGATFSFYALPRPNPSGKASVGFPAVETAKLFVQISGSISDAAQFAQLARIVTGVLPINLRASVSGRPVFFTHPGPLDKEVELTGLAAELNAIAASATAVAPVNLDLVADTPGALITNYTAASDLSIESSLDARWGGRDRLEVVLQALNPTPVELIWPSDSALPLRRIVLTLAGSFPRWRAFGPVGAPAAKLATKVSAQFSVARRFDLPGRTVLHGLALPLLADGKAELRLEIVADDAGAPADTAKPLASVDLTLDGDGGDAATWIEALAATPFDTGTANALWVLLKGKSGAVQWIAASEATSVPPATLYTNEGGRWRRYPVRGGQSPAPLLRVLREPLARENAPLATLSWATGSGTPLALTADPSDATPATLEFTLPAGPPLVLDSTNGSVTATVVATVAASGTLVLRRATGYFGS